MLLGASIRQFLNDVRAFDVAVVDANGAQLTGFDGSRPATAAITTVSVAATSTSVLPANAARRRVVLYNDSGKKMWIAFAATASASAFTFVLPANNGYDGVLNDYTGDITAIVASGTANLIVTEITT